MPASINISVPVSNIAGPTGDEVVQLYVSDKQASLTPWQSVLRGFKRVRVAPGATETVHFELKPEDLAMLDKQNRLVVEPGEFEISIGTSSTTMKHKMTVRVQGNVFVLEKCADPYTYGRSH